MGEIFLSHLGGIKLLVVALLGWMYSRAGRGWKIWGIKIRRRTILPLILCGTWVCITILTGIFTWTLLLLIGVSWLIYYGTLSIGYGTTSWLRNVLGKTAQQYLVAIQGVSCVLIAIYTQRWGLYSLCVLTPALTLGALGSWADSDTDAAFKEALVGASIFLFSVFMI